MNIELKVKSCSLAAEARIIRKLANVLRTRQIVSQEYAATHDGQGEDHAKLFREQRLNIQDHRRGVVRTEARATHLARAFLSGMPYRRVEAKTWNDPDWTKVTKMVEKYMVPDQDNRPVKSRVKEWREVA